VAPPPDIVEGLIRLTDDLLDLTEHASGPESDARALRLVQRRVERLLADCGARIVRDDGPVNASRHTVVAVRPATADGPEGWIAGTVRPGYLHGGQLIRPQQVVAYTIEQPAGTMEGNDHEG
jgi:molecular chaperone GrpE (heat shock protein)